MLSLLAEFWTFLKARKKFWLVPLMISLFVLGLLLVVAKGSAVAPFIYTLF
jgi:competence protein ComGC